MCYPNLYLDSLEIISLLYKIIFKVKLLNIIFIALLLTGENIHNSTLPGQVCEYDNYVIIK